MTAPGPYAKTDLGALYLGNSEELLSGDLGKSLEGRVQLIFTSPPFPLNHKKRYGNLTGKSYRKWLKNLAPLFARLLKPDGSIVIELGNAWEKGKPVQSLLPLQSLLDFVSHKDAGLRLCQQFVCHNPARLPSPAQWVTIERCRITDSYTQLWWMATSDRPKADNRKVLRPYSKSMLKLLERGDYNSGKRPSGHTIGEKSFLEDHGGSIPLNLFPVEPINTTEPISNRISNNLEEVLRLPHSIFSLSQTSSNDFFRVQCKARGIQPHPAPIHPRLVDFFVQFLTDPGDLVLDPFSGSNVVGYVAEKTERSWVSFEAEKEYAMQSCIRFYEPGMSGIKIHDSEDEDLFDDLG